jgi:hypothetical protein
MSDAALHLLAPDWPDELLHKVERKDPLSTEDQELAGELLQWAASEILMLRRRERRQALTFDTEPLPLPNRS